MSKRCYSNKYKESRIIPDFLSRLLMRSAPFLMILPMMIFFVLVGLYPMIEVFRLSLMGGRKIDEFVGLQNYINLFGDKNFYVALEHTFVFVIISAITHIGLGLLIALILNQPMKKNFRAIARSVIMLPWAITPVVVGVIWQLIYNPYLSIVPAIFSELNLNIKWNFLGNTTLALPAVAVANVWFALPFYMIMILASLQSIPEDLYEAAMLDGASSFDKFRYVTIPLLQNILVTLLIFDFIGAFVFFDLIWVMTGGGPVNATEVLSTFAYRTGFINYKFGYASAIATIMFIIMLLCSGLLTLLMRKD